MSEKRLPTYRIGILTRGDSWRGIPSITVRFKDGSHPTNPVSSAEIKFRVNATDETHVLYLRTADNTIQILNAAQWNFAIPQILNFSVPVGRYVGDFETVDTTGFRETYCNFIMTVGQDVTRP